MKIEKIKFCERSLKENLTQCLEILEEVKSLPAPEEPIGITELRTVSYDYNNRWMERWAMVWHKDIVVSYERGESFSANIMRRDQGGVYTYYLNFEWLMM